MAAVESFGSANDITGTGNSDFSSLVYLIERDISEIEKKFDEIVKSGVPFRVLGAYSMNSRHCMAILIEAKVKKIKNKRGK